MSDAQFISDYDYTLPTSLIAQFPCEPRDAARLLLLRRESGALAHMRFYDLPQLLRMGDCLALNDSRVYPARIRARKLPSGGKVEILLLRRLEEGLWRALLRGRGLGLGARLQLESREHHPIAEVVARGEGGQRDLQFEHPILPLLPQLGEAPLPPYIRQPLADPERYQTIYSRALGSAAAPTAGLHFTTDTFTALRARGVRLAHCTLHIGLDTFQPMRAERVAEHQIHSEYVELGEEAAATINAARAGGGRIIAIGTTSARALESAAQSSAPGAAVAPYAGETSLFITPGYRWRAVDAMLTNFHLPRSTLLLMVSALAGRDNILRAYAAAIPARYRFYSFGDAMLII